jgi:hypothetical protein
MGCQRMGTVTYPDPAVATFITDRFVPVQLNVETDTEALEPYAVPWTPALIVLDPDERLHRRIIGFHAPAEVIAELSLAWLTEAIARGDVDAMQTRFELAREKTRGDPERAAEAAYLRAIVTYRETHDGLIAGWKEVVDTYPGTIWARKAAPFVQP